MQKKLHVSSNSALLPLSMYRVISTYLESKMYSNPRAGSISIVRVPSQKTCIWTSWHSLNHQDHLPSTLTTFSAPSPIVPGGMFVAFQDPTNPWFWLSISRATNPLAGDWVSPNYTGYQTANTPALIWFNGHLVVAWPALGSLQIMIGRNAVEEIDWKGASLRDSCLPVMDQAYSLSGRKSEN